MTTAATPTGSQSSAPATKTGPGSVRGVVAPTGRGGESPAPLTGHLLAMCRELACLFADEGIVSAALNRWSSGEITLSLYRETDWRIVREMGGQPEQDWVRSDGGRVWRYWHAKFGNITVRAQQDFAESDTAPLGVAHRVSEGRLVEEVTP